MPFTRHPLEYRINQLLLRVGMALQIELLRTPPIRDKDERRKWEQTKIIELGLDQAVEEGLITGYYFIWGRTNGQLRTIHVVPHPKYRRCPGILRMKELFFRELL